MRITKERFRKTGGTQFYHFVQPLSAKDDVTPQEVNAIGLEFAQKRFPNFKVVVATHVDTGHLPMPKVRLKSASPLSDAVLSVLLGSVF